MAKVSTILDEIDNGSIALPVFQRGYVWTRQQVRELFTSLYNGYPVGSLLVWKTSSSEVKTRGDLPSPAAPRQILLDGQQRMTSLYGVIRGHAPAFFDGNANAFLDLRFHLEDETFEFYQPVKMRNDPLWIGVSDLYEQGMNGIQPIILDLDNKGFGSVDYMGRLLTLLDIAKRELHIDLVTGKDKTVDVVVDIFDRVNSGGTKLTQGDLALAKICAHWTEAREAFQSRLMKWKKSGYSFNLDWLLRVINAIVTGKARFVHLHDINSDKIEEGLIRAEKYIDKILNMISNRLGLDHHQVLFANSAIPLMVAYLDLNNGNLTVNQADRLLYWYTHAGMWGRYSGSTETILDSDLSIIQDSNSPDDQLEGLLTELRRWRGGLGIEKQHFKVATRGARFYSVLYMMTRMGQSRDLYDGLPLRKHQLGKMAQLELHHIFPRRRLYKAGYNRWEVNTLANFCFLTKESNRQIGYKEPYEYLAKVEENNPGVLESQWIPTDRHLWKIENYQRFLEARRGLLAKAANELLDGLLIGRSELPDEPPIIISDTIQQRPASIADDEEEALLLEINEWMEEQGLSGGIFGYEIAHQTTGEQIAMFDLAWPEGVQSELSEPVALLIDEDRDVLVAAGSNGYRFFTNTEAFKAYIQNEILVIKPDETALQEIIRGGESDTVEFKSSLRMNLHIGRRDERLEHSVIKTLAGFLNREGGILLIGVDDNGTPVGIESDKFKSEDKMSLHLVNIVKARMGRSTMTRIRIGFETYQDKRIMKVLCDPSPSPVYVNDGKTERFYVRMGPSTDKLNPREFLKYSKERFSL